MTVAVLGGGLVTAGAGARDTPRTAPAARAPGTARTAAPRPAAPAGQPLAVLLGDHVVRSRPDASAPRIGAVGARRPLTHVRTRLPVLGEATAPGGGPWLHVRLPGRPNGHAGWISADRTRRITTPWRITVRLSERLVTVARNGRVEGRFRAVVGGSKTPTPVGHGFIEERLAVSGAGAPYALAASARSHVFQEFGGGDGQIALHGTTGIAGALGTAVSHGCVRLSPRAMHWLAKRIRPGVPLVVEK